MSIPLTKNIDIFLKELKQFNYTLNVYDHVWEIIFLDKKRKWHNLSVVKYQETYYISLQDREVESLEITPDKKLKNNPSFASQLYNHPARPFNWNELLITAIQWLVYVKKDWVKANKKIHQEYPLNRRKGIIPHAVVRATLPDIFQIQKILGKSKTKKFISIAESHYFHDDKKTICDSLTANDFFKYCKIAYLSSQEKNENINPNWSGRKMYERFADGRHNGLLDIDPDSKKEFADWIDDKHPKKKTGGHPWEIKRGGNTTHIDLYVSRPRYKDSGFVLTLAGSARTRLKETICMFLALYDEGLPITIANPEGIRRRLLAQDNLGIIPKHESLHRANQDFMEEEHVHDVLYYDDLGKFKNRLKEFITWEPLPLLTPVKIVTPD